MQRHPSRYAAIVLVGLATVMLWSVGRTILHTPNRPASPTRLMRQVRLVGFGNEDLFNMCPDKQQRRLYVYGFNDIVAVDSNTFKELGRLHLPDSMVYEIAVSPDGRQIAAADYSGDVLLISTSPLRVAEKVHAEGRPMRVAYDSHGARIYYSSPQERTVGYVGMDTKDKSKSVKVPFVPSGIAVSSSGVFFGADEGSSVYECHRDSLAVTKRIALPSAGPHGRPDDLDAPGLGPSEVVSDGKYLYAQAPISCMLWQVDLQSGHVLATNIGRCTGHFEVLSKAGAVTTGDFWNAPGRPTSLTRTNPFRTDRLVQTRTRGDGTDVVWEIVFSDDASVMYTLTSTASGAYLQERSTTGIPDDIPDLSTQG